MSEIRAASASGRQDFNLAVNALQDEIAQHRAEKQSQSYLKKAFDFVWRSDERSLSQMEALNSRAVFEAAYGTADSKAKLSQDIAEQIQKDRDARELQNNISFYGATTTKVASLFLRGKSGLVAAGVSFALDEAKVGDSFSHQMLDAGLGAGKGLLLKSAINGVIDTKLPFYAKGALLGATNRALETGLTRSTYFDQITGDLSLTRGLGQTLADTFNPRYIATDLVVMGAAYGAGLGVQKLAGEVLSRSPFWNTVATSATYGASASATAEVMAAASAGRALSFSRIGTQALIGGTVFGIAAVPGALQAEYQHRQAQENMKKPDSSDKTQTRAQAADGTDSSDLKQYKKVGQVKAEKLDRALEWKTSKGEVMKAEAGDWRITGSDGSTWSVKPDIFSQTYSEVGPGVFEKTAITRAMQLKQAVTIQTLEGQGTGVPGDYLVVGPKGEQYIVPKAKFESMYTPVNA